MPLFFPGTPKSQRHNSNTDQKTEKSRFQPSPDQQTYAKCDQGTTAKMIPPAHKNTPCTTVCAGGVKLN